VQHVVHDEIEAWVPMIFAVASISQAVAGEDVGAQGLSRLPLHVTGARQEPDDMLGAIDGLPGQDEPSWWAGPEMEAAAKWLTANNVPSMGSDGGLTAEFPYGENGGPAAMGGTSNMLMVTTSEPHPRMGSGVLMRLNLREQPVSEGRELTAMELNELELRARCQAHFLGSWCTNPSCGPPVFVSFLPSVLHKPNLLMNLVLSMGLRARWAATLLP
jgi:hypothetical protein